MGGGKDGGREGDREEMIQKGQSREIAWILINRLTI